MRSYNCLHRAGIETIGDLVERVSCEEDLRRLRNCGVKSVREIMGKVFCWQWERLEEKQKVKYVKMIMSLNVL